MLAAVNTVVISAPSTRPRRVSSFGRINESPLFDTARFYRRPRERTSENARPPTGRAQWPVGGDIYPEPLVRLLRRIDDDVRHRRARERWLVPGRPALLVRQTVDRHGAARRWNRCLLY